MSTKKKEDDEDDLPATPPAGFAVGAYGLVLFLGCRLLEIFLEAQATASAVGQAVLVEWASSRLGVVWTDAKTPQTTALVAKRAGLGIAVGVGTALALVVLLKLSGGASFESVANVSASVLVIGLITAALHAWRDELLLHGIVLRALGLWNPGDRSGKPHDVLRVVACGVTSAGAALGRSDASAKTILVAALLGIVFGALWVRDRGAWMPWGAHTALRFTTDTVIAGGITQIRLWNGDWAGGDSGLFSGQAAVVAFAPVAVLAMAAIVRRISPDNGGVG